MTAATGYYHHRVSFPSWVSDIFDPIEVALITAVRKRLVEGRECFPNQETLAKDIKRSKPTVCRRSRFLDRVGAMLITARGRRTTPLYDLPAWLQYARPPAGLAERVKALREDPECFIDCPKSISTPRENPESCGPRARGKVVEKWLGSDTSPASTDDANLEPAERPSDAVADPEAPKPPSGDGPAAAPDPPRRFTPLRGIFRRRRRKSLAEIQANRAKKSAKIERWLGSTRQFLAQIEYGSIVAGSTLAGGPAPPTPEQLKTFDQTAKALDGLGWDDIPESWYTKNGIAPPNPSLAPGERVPAPVGPAKSRAELYREALASVPMPGWHHGGGRAAP